jgi:CHAT domain-containing protein
LLQTLPPFSISRCRAARLSVNIRRRIRESQNKLNRIRRIAGLLLYFIAPVTCLCSCSAGLETEPLVEYSTEVVVTGSRSQVLTRQLDTGVYVLEVRERDIDLHVTLDCAGRHAELADASLRHGVLRTVVRLAAPARLRVTLDSLDVRGWKGAAGLRILRWPRTEPDVPDHRLLGFEALGASHELIASAAPEAWRAAREPLREAERQFQAAHDLQSMAEAEYLRGRVERDLLSGFDGETARLALVHFRSAGDVPGMRRASLLLASNELAAAARMGAETPRTERTALLDSAAVRLAHAGTFFEARGMHSDALEAADLDLQRMRLLGQPAEVIAAACESMLQRARRRGDAYFEVLATRGLADLALRQGDAARAARLYESVLAHVERPRNPDLYARLHGDLGRAVLALGEFDRALALHTGAFQLFAARGDDRHAARELLALATLQLRTGNLEGALAAADGALPLYQRAQDQPGRADALRLAATASAGMDRHDRALQLLRDAERLERDGPNLRRTRLLIAGELRVLGRLGEADAIIAKILPASDEALRADAFAERARLRLAQERHREQLADLKTADAAYARLNLDFNRIDSSSALALALLHAGDVDDARAAAEDAVAIESRMRARANNPEMRAGFLSASYSPYEARIEVEFAGGARGGESSWRAFRLADSIRARALTERLRSRLAGRPELSESRAAVQAALPEDTAVLAYFVGDRRSHAWLLTRRSLRHATLPGRRALEQLVRNFDARQRAGAHRADATASSMLLGGLLDGVGTKRLLVLPDGPLNGLPFAALPMPRGVAHEALIDRFAIAVAPSLALALRTPAAVHARGTRVAVVSDPVYTPDDRRLTALASRASQYRGIDADTDRLARLPYSALEARAVTRAFEGASIIELAGFNATVPRVIGLPARELNVLHFATHAEARRDAPEQSALLLSEYAADGSPTPVDRLTAADIRRSGLRADVVVLSGCATGDGRELRGEGVLGLTYGFLANGSHTVVASLWPVEDALTARFMQEFYGAYRTSGNAADALRLAQLRTRAIAGPSVWASFVIRSSGMP